MRSRLLPCPRLVVWLAAGAAMGCAKGGGASRAAKPEGPVLNEGAYAAADFGYVDPYPREFHPLTEPFFTAVRTDEVAFLVADTGAGWLRDDVNEAYGNSEPLPPEANDDCTVIESISGDLDGDGGPELVLIGSYDPGDHKKQLLVRVLAGGPSGWSVLAAFDVGDPGEDYLVGRIRVGDLDGDLRDELIVAATHDVDQSWVRVYEDPIEAGAYGVVRDQFDFPGKDEVRAAAAQIDQDGARELVIVEGSGKNAIAPVLDDARTGYALLAADLFVNTKGSPANLYSADAASVDLLIGDFDGDPRQEIAVYTMQAKNNSACWHECFDDFEAGLASFESVTGNVQGYWSPYDPAKLRRGIAADRDGDSIDEAIWLWTDADRVLATIEFHPTAPGGGGFFGINGRNWVAWNLAAFDDDADGRYEVLLSGIDDTSTCWWAAYDLVAPDQEVKYESGSRAVASKASLALAGDDFERDGTRVRWTGDKNIHLPNPFPLVIMMAPPTKDGISQDREASESSYSVKDGSSDTCETKTTTSYSFVGGIDIQNVSGTLGFLFKVHVSHEIESTTGTTNSVSRSLEFTGSYDHDVVIFEGTLHHSYEYEIVAAADPAAIGTRMAVNLPLGSKVYKWTRELFEERFGQDTLLPTGIFAHTLGDPTSYPKQDEALARLDTFEGYEGDKVTIGQGSGTNGCELELEEETVTSEGWTTEIGVETEVKLGGGTFGASGSLGGGDLHETTISKGTTFAGVVGDIANSTEYTSWGYDTAIFVYEWRGDDEELPVMVFDYWVDAWGTKY